MRKAGWGADHVDTRKTAYYLAMVLEDPGQFEVAGHCYMDAINDHNQTYGDDNDLTQERLVTDFNGCSSTQRRNLGQGESEVV